MDNKTKSSSVEKEPRKEQSCENLSKKSHESSKSKSTK